MKTTAEINRNYRIKAYGVIDDRQINTLLGVSGLINLIGSELADKFIDRANGCMEDVCVCKLRRGLKISFYVK